MLYILRHGKTDWNTTFRLQGQTNVPLNDEGRRMAVEAKEKYKDLSFDICFSSPLDRAFETAEIILKDRNVPIITDDRLVEMSFGICEGEDRILERPECPAYTLFHDPLAYKGVEGGETLEELFDRTGAFLKEVIFPRIEKGEDILIVGHGAMNSSIICQIRELSKEDFPKMITGNCEMEKLID